MSAVDPFAPITLGALELGNHFMMAPMTRARAAETAGDLNEVRGSRDQLEQASLPLAAVLMDDVVKGAVAGKKLGDL